MKLKLASLGLLALAPLAAQAELVEMQDTALAEVNGQGFSWSGSANAAWTGTVGGYGVSKTLAIFKDGYCPVWSVNAVDAVSSPYSGNTYTNSLSFGSDHGTKYFSPSFSWGPTPI